MPNLMHRINKLQTKVRGHYRGRARYHVGKSASNRLSDPSDQTRATYKALFPTLDVSFNPAGTSSNLHRTGQGVNRILH